MKRRIEEQSAPAKKIEFAVEAYFGGTWRLVAHATDRAAADTTATRYSLATGFPVRLCPLQLEPSPRVGDTVGRPTLAGFAFPDECPFNVPPESIDSVQDELENDPDYLDWLEQRAEAARNAEIVARWRNIDHAEHDSNGGA